MSETYEKAKELAKKIVELEVARKNVTTNLKLKKDELLDIIQNNSIESTFEFPEGLVFVDTTTDYKIADGLTEETEVKSKSPQELSQYFLESYFKADLKLTKRAKQAIKEEDTELLAVLVPSKKQKVVVKVLEKLVNEQD